MRWLVSMKVMVDESTCQGHGLCMLTAPDLFDFDETGSKSVVQVEGGDVPAEEHERARAAVTSCPEAAISLVDGRG